MPNVSDEEMNRIAKTQALKHLRDSGFYEPEKDNPEGLDLDQKASPEDIQKAQDMTTYKPPMAPMATPAPNMNNRPDITAAINSYLAQQGQQPQMPARTPQQAAQAPMMPATPSSTPFPTQTPSPMPNGVNAITGKTTQDTINDILRRANLPQQNQ